MLRNTFLILLLLKSLCLFATTPTVMDVTAKQRFPWNGFVDIKCKVAGIEESKPYEFRVNAVMPDSGSTNKLVKYWVVQDGAKQNNFKVTANGDYHLIWDAKAELGSVLCTNMIVCVTLEDWRDKVQLWEGGPYWATTNIGAEKPEDYGYYFWWGDTVGYKRENYKWVASDGSNSNFSFSESNTPTYDKPESTLRSEGWITSDGVLAPEHDAATVHWGNGWRMPTKDELSALNNKCDWTWTTLNGVIGYVVKGRGAYASKSIFLPAAGYGIRTSPYLVDSYGYYWSSVSYSDDNDAWGLSFLSSRHDAYDYNRFHGQLVRPVMEALIYAVKFDANGGDGSTILMRTDGVMLGELPTSTRNGYIFAGWWTAAEGGTQVNASTAVTSNVTYYAHWTLPSLVGGVDAVDLNYTTGGDSDWVFQTGVSHDNQDAVQSGNVDDRQSSWMETTIEGPATVSFWWKVSSESKYDKLRFYIDSVEQDAISGVTGWTQKIYSLDVGNHVLKWEYAKDFSNSEGDDCGWVDQVVVTTIAADTHSMVQLWERGPYWATTNIGAENPWDSGYYFWWGDTVGYKKENNLWAASDGSNSNFLFSCSNVLTCGKSMSILQVEGIIASDGVLVLEHDAANVHWGNGWRMPTKAEFDALNSNCDWNWTTMNGVSGYVVKGRGAYASNSIFLSAPGYVRETSFLRPFASPGNYWSSVLNDEVDNDAWGLSFGSSDYYMYGYGRNCGLQVRPLKSFVK